MNELGTTITPDMPTATLVMAARAMSELAVEVILDKVGTPHRFPGVDEVSYGQRRFIMEDTERYLRRRGARRSEVDNFVWNAMQAAKVARDYGVRSKASGAAVDRARVWRAYVDAARWSRLVRL
ncbi:hypothetical protein [Nocardiopsis sp. LOL_012]|uniref:hypothetical protein n=1 Tax=Nocardiopsis sp. LOL_012 TaxID=3345409 RepID=UPI003A85310B